MAHTSLAGPPSIFHWPWVSVRAQFIQNKAKAAWCTQWLEVTLGRQRQCQRLHSAAPCSWVTLHPAYSREKNICVGLCDSYTSFQRWETRLQASESISIRRNNVRILTFILPSLFPTGVFCNGTFDQYVCWPHSSPGNVSVPCPSYLPGWNEGNESHLTHFWQFLWRTEPPGRAAGGKLGRTSHAFLFKSSRL